MGAPAVSFTIATNNLGQQPVGAGNVIAVVGTSSSGTANQPYLSPVPQNFITNFGYGPGPQLAALTAASSGANVLFVKATASTPGAVSGTIHVGTGTSVMTVTGAPFDDYYLVVTPTTGTAAIGTAGAIFTVSIDGGLSVYQTVTLGTANSYVVPNTGLTLNFGAGTLVAADTYSTKCTAPLWSDATVTSAITSVIGQTGYTLQDIYVTGPSASSNATNRNTDATTLFGKSIYTNIVLDARDAAWGGTSSENEQQWMQSIQTDYLNFAATNGQVAVTAGHYPCVSPIDQSQMRRPLSWFCAARDADVNMSVDLGRVSDGPLTPMVIPATPVTFGGSSTAFILHNEASNPGLDGSRFISAFTINGLQGFYVVNPNTMAQSGNALNWLQLRHVLDQFLVTTYNFFVQRLSSSVRVSSTTGFILPQDANTINNGGNAALNTSLVYPGFVSSATINVATNNNILSTHQLIVNGTIVPLAYLKTISVTVGFLNPTITPV